ncbi:MAG: CHAP domain-containing protein [Gammaproteobacteria bacterium]|nr:CHAP domain-containing protein [Gammaproteobacteria bacterium]MDH3535830.1 CHAP domain-containing protein [Gammaproteobacteria bacterium]
MPRTLRRLEADPEVSRLHHLLSAHGYFADRPPPDGIFETVTHDNVVLFQLQHVDRRGIALKADGVVGAKTWWALENPSGDAQRNHFQPYIPQGLEPKRRQLLELIYEEHGKPVFEVPDGSNRSPDIDGYWGQTGIIGQPWCCAFVSWALKEALGEYPIEGKHHIGVQNMWRAARRVEMETPAAKPGDIFVQIHSGGKGHTGFVVGVSTDGKSIYTGEGNCGNRLKIGKRRINTINHFIDCIRDGQTLEFGRSKFDVAAVESQTTR